MCVCVKSKTRQDVENFVQNQKVQLGLNDKESEELMQQAERLVHQCIRGIWNGEFEPTDQRVPYDDYQMILQTGVTQRLMDAAEVETELETAG